MSTGVRKIARQHYVVTIELPPDPITGKRRRESHTVHGPREQAEALCSKLLVDRQRGEYVARARSTVADVLHDWLSEKSASVSPRTFEKYGQLVDSIIPALGALPVQKLTTKHVQDYYNECRQTVSPVTVRHRHVALRQALQRAVRRGFVVRNVTTDVALPKVENREMRCLDSGEARTLIAATAGTSLEVPVRLALDTGMRLSELLAVRWSDCDFDARCLTVNRSVLELGAPGNKLSFKGPKSASGRRSVDLAGSTVAFLRAHSRAQAEQRMAMGPGWADNDLVICNGCGEPVRPSVVSRHFGRFMRPPAPEPTKRNPDPEPKKGPLSTPCRFHDLRHTHASLALAAGTPVKVVSKRLGHQSIVITLDLYAHVLPGQDREAAEAVASAIYGAAAL